MLFIGLLLYRNRGSLFSIVA